MKPPIELPRSPNRSRRLLLPALLAIAGCGAPVVKPDAFALDVLEGNRIVSEHVVADRKGERRVEVETGWMADVAAGEELTFAALRIDGEARHCLVLRCEPEVDRLVLLPLGRGGGAGEGKQLGPLDVLADEGLRAEMAAAVELARTRRIPDGAIERSLREVVDGALLTSPLPEPEHVFAVAANYPSHLRTDLAIEDAEEKAAGLATARPRVFLKHPVTRPFGSIGPSSSVVGPFEGLRFPERLFLPAEEGESGPEEAETRMDYEVEIGVVFGRDLGPADVDATDAELRAAVAGYVLVSDAKARNPQIFSRVESAYRDVAPESAPYRIGDEDLARVLGPWDAKISTLWSYAASFGAFTAIGPFFVEAPADGSFPRRAMITARSYGPAASRGAVVPDGRRPDVAYLRQCSVATEDGHPDALIWEVPAIVRSILAPDSVLTFPDHPGDPPRIQAGDVLCLGTPGGTILTARRGFHILRRILFWWVPRDWHDKFFSSNAGQYLRDGDVVFYWAEGLGFQVQRVAVERGATGSADGS